MTRQQQCSGQQDQTRVRTGPPWLAAALVAVLLGVSMLSSGGAGAQQRRVVVVGDSIILGAQSTMTRAFEDMGWEVIFDAAVSRSTSAGGDAIQAHSAELTDTLVINLGANDAGNTESYRRKVEQILNATSSVPHVYWLTIREVRDYYPAANQALRDAAAGFPNVTVLDWNERAAGSDGLTSGDGLHLTGAGASEMSVLVAFAVVSGGAPAPAPFAALPPAPVETAPPTTVPVAAPETTVAAAVLGEPVAPETTVVAESTTTVATTSTTTVERDDVVRYEDAATTTVDYGNAFTWTLGSGLAVAVIVLAVIGAGVGGWALFASHGRPATEGSDASGPAMTGTGPPTDRARQRAERIAAARVAASATDSSGSPPT